MIHRSYLCAAVIGVGLGGCAVHQGPYQPQTESARDPARAQSLTMQVTGMIERDPVKAEAVLREALTADLYFGPAHNDLGVIYLKRGDLFSAASEFEWAARLMPNHPDPRMNLALTLERAGRTEEALSAYATALEVYQGHIPTIEAMTRLQVRSGRVTSRTRANLEEIALKGENQKWREWARLQAIRLIPGEPH